MKCPDRYWVSLVIVLELSSAVSTKGFYFKRISRKSIKRLCELFRIDMSNGVIIDDCIVKRKRDAASARSIRTIVR